MTPEREGELFAKIDMLMAMVAGNAAQLTQMREDIGLIKGGLEEQSRLLIKLVPQQIAAVASR